MSVFAQYGRQFVRINEQKWHTMISLSIERDILQNFSEAVRREWLETNGLGGWASSTISGANTRRYHGLLVVATRPPVGRLVMLSKLDETLAIGEERFDLSANIYPGVIHPEGFRYLAEFTKYFFPVFTYRAAGVCIRKTVAAIHAENTTVVFYEVLEAPSAFFLELRPFVAGRDYHRLTKANDAIQRSFQFQQGIFQVRPYENVPELFVSVPGAEFMAAPEWYFNFEYPVEHSRGQDFNEDLFTYGHFTCSLKAGETLGVIISMQDPAKRDALKLLQQERQRHLLEARPGADAYIENLILAADQFLVKRDEELRTVIAGYHWFSDWGRDTMIALPGLTLVTGRFADAKKILQAFAANASQAFCQIVSSTPANCPNTTPWMRHFGSLWQFINVFNTRVTTIL
jgi:predicted glycogen debranching enzyme